ncbi:MAG TPA: hypothetical protein VMB91_01990, partial [Solirubrobacteraceae bacterium]|nr:hypothetical protein [Solirubrobacteraceae bacterium]
MRVSGELSAADAASARCRLVAIVLALAGSSMLAGGAAAARAALPAFASSRDGVRAVCPAPDTGSMRCHALELTPPTGG